MLHFTLFADYFQFYLQDDRAEGRDIAAQWSDDDVARMLTVGPGVVGVGTARNMSVAVSVELLGEAPALNLNAWDHVVDCTLVAHSGSLVLAGSTDYLPDAPRIPVAPGTYRVRFAAAGLDTLSDDGLDGDDRYQLQLWPSSAAEPTVLKRYAGLTCRVLPCPGHRRAARAQVILKTVSTFLEPALPSKAAHCLMPLTSTCVLTSRTGFLACSWAVSQSWICGKYAPSSPVGMSMSLPATLPAEVTVISVAGMGGALERWEWRVSQRRPGFDGLSPNGYFLTDQSWDSAAHSMYLARRRLKYRSG